MPHLLRRLPSCSQLEATTVFWALPAANIRQAVSLPGCRLYLLIILTFPNKPQGDESWFPRGLQTFILPLFFVEQRRLMLAVAASLMNWPDLLQSLRSPLGFHEKGKLYLSRKCLQTPGKVKETNSPGFHFCPTLSSLPCPSCTTDQALSTSLALLLGSIFSWLPRWLTGDKDSVPGLGRCPGGGNGNPLQYSCLGNPMDRRAWWATARGAAEELDMSELLNNNNSTFTSPGFDVRWVRTVLHWSLISVLPRLMYPFSGYVLI